MQSAIIRSQRSVFETRIHVESVTGTLRKVIVYCGHRGTAHGGSLADLWASPFTTALSDSMNTEPMSLHFDDTGTASHATDGVGAYLASIVAQPAPSVAVGALPPSAVV